MSCALVALSLLGATSAHMTADQTLAATSAVGSHRHFSEAAADGHAGVLTQNSPVLAPFPLEEVRLLPGSAMWDAQQLNLKYMLMLPVSSLAYNFLNTSGLPVGDAKPLGGWETPYGPEGDDRGHFTGHYLSASALAVAATGNAELNASASALVASLRRAQIHNAKAFPKFGPGYLSGFPTLYFDCLENLWRSPCRYMQVPYYNIHKIMQGLLDQHLLLGTAEALPMVVDMAAYFGRRIDAVLKNNGSAVWDRILETECGGMNDVLYQLYRVTAAPLHLRLAHLFDKQSWFGGLLNGTDILAGHHANTHLALTVGGATRADVLGDSAYAGAVSFFSKTLSQAHAYATGGSNYREFWNAAHSQGASLFSATDHFAGHDNEESCTTYNFLKIQQHLFRWSAAPEAMEMYSHSMENGVLGIQHSEPGVMIYLLPLGNGVTKGNSSRGWGTPLNSFWCCYGTGIESFSKLADSVYFKATTSDGLTVARYVSSTLNYVLQDGAVFSMTQQSTVNFNQSATFTVTKVRQASAGSAATAAPLDMRLRVPSWAGKGSTVTLNGNKVGAIAAGCYVVVTGHVWKAGDVVAVTFPTKVVLRALDDRGNSCSSKGLACVASFMYGDVLLVGLEHTLGASNELVVPSADPSAWVAEDPASEARKIRFTAKTAHRTVTLMPLSEVIEERYTVYYNITVAGGASKQ